MDFGLSQMWSQAMSPQSMSGLAQGMGNVAGMGPQQMGGGGGDGFWDQFGAYMQAGGAEDMGNFIGSMGQGGMEPRQVIGGRSLAPAQGQANTQTPGMLLLSRLAGLGGFGGRF